MLPAKEHLRKLKKTVGVLEFDKF